MAVLVEREIPQTAAEAVRNVVTGLAARAAFRTPNLSRADPGKLTLAKPHRFAMLTLQSLRDDRRTPRPKMIGWRFLIEADGETLASAEALPDGNCRIGTIAASPSGRLPASVGTSSCLSTSKSSTAARKA